MSQMSDSHQFIELSHSGGDTGDIPSLNTVIHETLKMQTTIMFALSQPHHSFILTTTMSSFYADLSAYAT